MDFLSLLNISEEVRSAIYSHCRANDADLLKLLLYQDDRLDDLVLQLVEDNSGDFDKFATLDQWLRLSRAQRCYEQRCGLKICGKSRSECLKIIADRYGELMAKDFEESCKFSIKKIA